MKTSSPRELIDLLQKKSLRIRTGIWLLPVLTFGKETEQAARLNLDTIDIREPLLESLPEGTRFLGLSGDKVLQLMEQISNQRLGTECLLVCNVDLLLAKLRQQERANVWKHLFDSFPNRRHALLIAMPEGAEHLLPSLQAMKLWNNDMRLAATNPIDL
jgi:hypothetical protein